MSPVGWLVVRTDELVARYKAEGSGYSRRLCEFDGHRVSVAAIELPSQLRGLIRSFSRATLGMGTSISNFASAFVFRFDEEECEPDSVDFSSPYGGQEIALYDVVLGGRKEDMVMGKCGVVMCGHGHYPNAPAAIISTLLDVRPLSRRGGLKDRVKSRDSSARES